MSPRYRVTLIREKRKELETEPFREKTHAGKFIHARALLTANVGADGSAWGVTNRSIEHLEKRFGEDGLEAGLERKAREEPPWEVMFD